MDALVFLMGVSRTVPFKSAGGQILGSPGRQQLCDWCAPRPWERPLGQCKLLSVTAPGGTSGTFTFSQFFKDDLGNVISPLAPGQYVVRYCRGAWLNNQTLGLWSVAKEPAAGYPVINGYNNLWVDHSTNPGPVQNAFFNEVPPPPNGYASYRAAELAVLNATAQGCVAAFTHTGGDVQLHFEDSVVSDNFDAQFPKSNPVFVLCRVQPFYLQSAPVIIASYVSGTSPQWQLSIRLFYAVPIAFTGLTVSIRATGNIANPSAAQALDATTIGLKNPIFTCDITSADHSGVVTVDIAWNGNIIQTFALPIAPLLVVNRQLSCFGAPANFTGPCGIPSASLLNVWVDNLGNVDALYATANIIEGGGILNVRQAPYPCALTDALVLISPDGTKPPGFIAAGSHGITASAGHVAIMDPQTAGAVALSAFGSEGGTNYPTFNGTINRC